MNLGMAQQAGKAFMWLLTLGKSELLNVRRDVEQLINELRKSLVSMYDLATEVTRLDPSQLDKNTFAPIEDYVTRFYLNPQDVSAARTHCAYVRRDVERIMFKLGKLLHSDLGKWGEAKDALDAIIGGDGELIANLDAAIIEVRGKLDEIKTALDRGDVARARQIYGDYRESLKPDIAALGEDIAAMEKANQHLWSITA